MPFFVRGTDFNMDKNLKILILGAVAIIVIAILGSAYFNSQQAEPIPDLEVESVLDLGRSTLRVPQGGTGQSSFPPNALLATGSTASSTPLVATTTPTFNNFVATSTTATSTIEGFLTIGTSTPHQESMLNIESTNVDYHGLKITGAASQVEHLLSLENNAGTELFTVEDSGETEIFHVATEDFDHGLHVTTDAAGFGSVNGILIDYDTGAVAGGEEATAILISLNRTDSTGGEVHGIVCGATSGSAEAECIEVGVGITVIEHSSGTFGDPLVASSTDNGTLFIDFATSTTENATIFVDDNDEITVGSASQFGSIEVTLVTVASGAGIQPTFEFSSSNDGVFTTFAPVDGTNGFRANGAISFEIDDLPTWVTGSDGNFLIRITRTQNGLGTSPVERQIQLAATTEYFWNSDGAILVENLFASSTLVVDGLVLFNGGLTLETGDTFTLNGDAFTDLTGTGLTISSNTLIPDLTGGTGITFSNPTVSFDCSEVEGVGINCSGENITLDATGDWTGTLDLLEAASFLRSDAADTATGALQLLGGATTTELSVFTDARFGATATSTFDGSGNLLINAAGTLTIPQSATCDSNANGEICHDTTDDQFMVDGRVIQTKVRIWGVTIASTSPAFINASTTPIAPELDGYTMTEIRCFTTGSGSPTKVIAIQDLSENTTEDITCAETVTSDDGSITNAAVTAAEQMVIDFGSSGGTQVDYVTISVFGTWTRE